MIKVKNLSAKLTGFILLLATIVVIVVLFLSVSDNNITFPKTTHTHAMIKFYNNGSIYKTNLFNAMSPSDQTLCSGLITSEPIHFHDNVEDIIHLHWDNITGGQVLKYLGANYIGGFNNLMGIRLDRLNKYKITPIYTKDKALKPYPESLVKIYIKKVSSTNYEKVSLSDFIKLELSSLDPSYKPTAINNNILSNPKNYLWSKARAHNDEGDLDGDGSSSNSSQSKASKPSSLSSVALPHILFYTNQVDDISEEQLQKDDASFTSTIDSQCNG